MISITNPATGGVIASVNEDTNASIDEKFLSLKNQRINSTTAERKAALMAFADDLEKNIDDLSKTLSDEVGKPITQARGEIKDTARRTKFFVDNIDSVAKTRKLGVNSGTTESIRFEPLGLILCISAWNYPYFVSTNVVLPALLAGCRVIFKPSELATLSGQKMSALLTKHQAFSQSLVTIIGGKEVGASLVKKNFDGIFFTGSEKAGLEIKKAIGSRMIKSQFELGGKDAAYVRKDCNLDHALSSLVDGAFFNCGQSCCSIERIYLHQDIAKEFKSKFIAATKKLKIGDPSDKDTYLGPLTRREQVGLLLEQVADAKNHGANIALGGHALEGTGNYFAPTIICEANNKMQAMVEESFGPIVCIEEVASDDEAVEKINSSRFGLTAALYSEDQKVAEQILERLEVGSVYWNCCDKVSSALPWSGRKNSGLGVTLSTLGMEMFLKPKAWYLGGMKNS